MAGMLARLTLSVVLLLGDRRPRVRFIRPRSAGCQQRFTCSHSPFERRAAAHLHAGASSAAILLQLGTMRLKRACQFVQKSAGRRPPHHHILPKLAAMPYPATNSATIGLIHATDLTAAPCHFPHNPQSVSARIHSTPCPHRALPSALPPSLLISALLRPVRGGFALFFC